jgi:zinc transport system substrate-binding protein
MPILARPALVALALLAGTSCTRAAPAGSRVRVAAGLYPLAYVARLVGGDRIAVTDLTPPGAEPHEIELTPGQVSAIQSAALVLVVKGLQPAIDDAAPRGRTLDARGTGKVRQDATGGADPHVWLDPSRLAAFAMDLAARLGTADKAHAAEYLDRGRAASATFAELDVELRTGLAHCTRHEIVTSHAAFGYLADRYGLTQVGISGLVPDAEPSPGRVAEVARYVRAHAVTTVFFESLVSPKVARTVARETGAKTAVLDPIESVRGGDDYVTVLRRNLAALRTALGCT